MKPKLVVITGTTASGKTELAINQALELNGEIISADSRQLYRHLDIITGKDITEPNFQLVKTLAPHFNLGYYTIAKVPVWLYDIVDPKQTFSSYDWAVCAKEAIKLIIKKNKTPILVGGSYFYLQSLLNGLTHTGIPPNLARRQRLEKLSLNELQNKLQTLDPDVYAKLNSSDRQNKRRLVRWLEKIGTTNFSESASWPGIERDYQIQYLGLRFSDKEVFKTRVRARIDKRLAQGALDEVELLLQMGYSPDDPGMQTIGYCQLLAYLKDELTLEQAKEIWFNKEMQYAKRQVTFMKKNPQISWEIL